MAQRAQAAGLVLAAGGGRRYGMPKALVRYQGELLVDRAVATLRAGGCEPVLVVLGAAADRVRAEATLAGATPVVNPDWAAGLGSSLRVGLAALSGTPAWAAVVLLVDTPGITPAAVRRVVAAGRPVGVSALVTAGYQDRPGHPVLLGRAHWAGVSAELTGDRGARQYLAARAAQVRTVPCADVADDTDLDRPDDAGPGPPDAGVAGLSGA